MNFQMLLNNRGDNMARNIKTNEYFQLKIESERKRISKFESALNDLEPSNVKGIRMGKIHLSNLYLNCIKLTYSRDLSFDGIFPDYMKLLAYYKEVCTSEDSLYDIIDILSIGVLLQNYKKQFIEYLKEIITKYESDDGMIVFFMDYLNDKNLRRADSVMDYFNVLLKSDDKEKILKEELEVWYDNHKDAYWYNSHESKNDTYCGYWCFEIAALAKIFCIDDRLLCANSYYPCEIKK